MWLIERCAVWPCCNAIAALNRDDSSQRVISMDDCQTARQPACRHAPPPGVNEPGVARICSCRVKNISKVWWGRSQEAPFTFWDAVNRAR